MADLPKRAIAIILAVTGLGLATLGVCLIVPALRADGVGATHELAHLRREFRRHTTLEVAGTAWSGTPSEGSEPVARPQPACPSTAAPAVPPKALRVAEVFVPRRLLQRPRSASRPTADDPPA